MKIPGHGGKLPGTYQVDADLASSAEQSRPRGPVVLPIFIRQGWPQAMIHLPLMRRGFTTPYSTSRSHTSAQVRSAAEGGVMGRGEARCSEVSGKSLASPGGWDMC